MCLKLRQRKCVRKRSNYFGDFHERFDMVQSECAWRDEEEPPVTPSQRDSLAGFPTRIATGRMKKMRERERKVNKLSRLPF